MKFCSDLALRGGVLLLLLLASRAEGDGSNDLSRPMFRSGVAPRSEFTSTGFIDAAFYPLHAEYPANFGLPLKDEITARYAVSTDVRVDWTKVGAFGELYLFLPLGDTRPKTSYNYGADPIYIEVQPTLGYSWTPHMEARLTYDEAFDLGRFSSRDEVTPWLSLSMRYGTTKPLDIFHLANLSGWVEPSFFIPGLEYPATPGASPRGVRVKDFSRAQIVNARYSLGFHARLQPSIKYLDWAFVFFDPELFFGNATLEDHDRFGGDPLTAFLTWGFGAQLGKNVELRYTLAQVNDLGGAPAGLLTLRGQSVSLRYMW